MDDEFKLCWKNFQDNIATGFQSLYDRGDLVDVTLACDGKLLQAHKFVLAICSPYFQEIFISNPCKHPIIILKDVSYNIMCELLEFMYQGVVNVKHTELQAFMKIGQLLQIKGLATNSSAASSATSDVLSCNNQPNTGNEETPVTVKALNTAPTEIISNEENSNICGDKQSTGNSLPNTPQRSQSPNTSPAVSPMQTNSLSINQGNKSNNSNLSVLQNSSHGNSSICGLKRHTDYNSDTLSIYSRNKHRRSITSTDLSSENTDCADANSVTSNMDHMNTEDFFLPHISMVESRYELNNIKRENLDHHQNTGTASAAAVAAASFRNSFNSAAFGLDYTFYKNNNVSSQSNQEYPNELHMSNDYSKSFANHMDIPPNCPNVVMLSSTSLLHGNCVFNRNNTVATQQGMKTYWLCKSYRISMCRARCITHQGKIISATGIHNHAPHMRGNNNASGSSNAGSSGSGTPGSAGINNNNAALTTTSSSNNLTAAGHSLSSSLRYSQNSSVSINSNHQNYQDHQHPSSSPPQQHSSAFVASSHVHPGNSNSNAIAPPSHLFLQSMPNLLVQHYPNSQSTQIMQPSTFTTQHHNVLHSYEISPSMQPSPSDEHSRNTNTSFDQNDKTLDSINKTHINDDHIIGQNAAGLSPSNVQNSCIKTSLNESLTQQNEIRKKLPSVEQHQVQVIDSITISPGRGHNFKMESI